MLRHFQKLVVCVLMEYTTPYESIVLMGKIASGKGTQANLILSHFGGVLYSNGNKVRENAQKPSVFGHKIKALYESGQLIPEWIASYWMTHAILSQHADERIVFEAVAKKRDEAELFHEIHTWMGRSYIVFNIAVSDASVKQRSEKRARDVVDSPKSVEARLLEHTSHTEPSIALFRSKGKLIDIDGEQTEEDVRKQIFSYLIK